MVKHDFDIRNAKEITEIVDCIQEGTYGDAPEQLIRFFDSLPQDASMNYLRTLAIPFIFHDFESHVKSNQDPISHFSTLLTSLKNRVESMVERGDLSWLLQGALENTPEDSFEKEIKTHTGQHYGSLFKAFDNKSYFEEAKKLLSDRLTRNGVNLPELNESRVLDQGCGGGRYTTAWKLLGAKEAVGLDFSETGLADARARVEYAELDQVNFVQGSALSMPLENESFDIVYSNGVLHHTDDWKKGISEQLRVLRSGGWGWQYLIEKPGGIFWDQIEILRAIMRDVPKPFAQHIMKGLGIPANRVFYMLDHVMVPVNTRLSPEELQIELEKHGAIDVQRLERGTDFDRVEAIYQKYPGAKEKFGVGENRFVFRKK